MLIISKKHHGIDIRDCWYADTPVKKKGIIRYRYYVGENPSFPGVQDRTLLTDLTETEEEMVANFSKNCRYEVRRAPKEGVTCRVVVGKELLKGNNIEAFVDFFADFWKSKGVEYQEKSKCMDEIRWYAENDAFAIAMALLGEKVLVYHTYIVEKDRVRLYQSASQFRLDETVSQQLVGFANRYLHKEDMLFFKKQGKKIYDWGGAGTSEEVASITRFKESFGGKEAYYYNGEQVNGCLARGYKWLVKMISR